MDTNISVNTGHSRPDSIAVQEPGCGARGSLHRDAGRGALLHTEPEERGPVLWSELKADAAIDH